MKRLGLFILLFSVITLQGFSQSNRELDSLNNLRKVLQLKIKDLQSQLHDVKQQIETIEAKQNNSSNQTSSSFGLIKAQVGNGGAILRDAPSSTGISIANIPANADILVHPYQQNLYFKVTYEGKTGYVSYSTISQNQEIDDFLSGKTAQKNNVTTTVIRNVDENDPKYKKLEKLYGKEKAIRIMNSELWAGMSYGMVIESVGKPISKNSTNTSQGLKEQWIYNDAILEFVNGELKSWNKK